MTRIVTIAVLQAAFGGDERANFAEIEALTRAAAKDGADIVLPPELFSGPYFCKTQDEVHFARAHPWQSHPAVRHFMPLAKALGIVIPVSIFEKDGPNYFNSTVMIDSDGALLGVYRKSHIPDGPGYQEKFYFRPGDTGFKVWETRKGRIGLGICWDQWFPEAARAMALAGAEVLLYPSAIGAEPEEPGLDTAARWRRAMVGHAVCNVIPVAAANRVGIEDGQCFYGTSFIAAQDGRVLAELDRKETGYALTRFDLDEIEQERASWGFFRDRRPEFY